MEEETIPAGILQDILRRELARVRETALTEKPFRCWVCNRWSRNDGAGLVCITCMEENASSDPLVMIGRKMGWRMGWPVDLLHVLQAPDAVTLDANGEPHSHTTAELFAMDEDDLAALFDRNSRFVAHNMVSKTSQTENRTRSEGFESHREWIELPEDQKIYAQRPRPRTTTERAAEKTAQDQFYALDRQRVETAARSAAIKVLERSLMEARKLGIDTDYID